MANLCKIGIMSTCSCSDWSGQSKCDFAKEASYGNRCRFFVFDEFCDNIKAQEDANKPIEKIETISANEMVKKLKEQIIV